MKFLALATAVFLPLSALAAPLSSAAKTVTVATSTLSPILVSSALPATPTPTPADNGACDKLVQACITDDEADPNGAFREVFLKTSCVMAFACRSPTQTVDQTIQEMWHSKAVYPFAVEEPRLSINLFNLHSSDGKTWTQQNFIDTYYGRLSFVGGPFPPSADIVIGYWSNIAAWTGFCATKTIPYQNLADWYTYSSTVQGAVAKC